jgi:hypothetical protein
VPRQKLPIDESQVEELAAILCTMEEIAAVVGCSVDTLERRFADTIKKGRERGKSSLRRIQWRLAQDGNAALAIWLGKQWLGQADKIITQDERPHPDRSDDLSRLAALAVTLRDRERASGIGGPVQSGDSGGAGGDGEPGSMADGAPSRPAQ